MKKIIPVLLLLIAFAALAGCGSKGPLFLPPPPVAQEAEVPGEPVIEDEPAESDDAEDAQAEAEGDSEKDPAGDANG